MGQATLLLNSGMLSHIDMLLKFDLEDSGKLFTGTPGTLTEATKERNLLGVRVRHESTESSLRSRSKSWKVHRELNHRTSAQLNDARFHNS